MINYYYNLNIESTEDWDNLYIFEWNHNKFYFVPLNRTAKELIDLV